MNLELPKCSQGPHLGAAEGFTHNGAPAVIVDGLFSESIVSHLGDIVVQQDVVDLDVPDGEKGGLSKE